MKIMLVYFSATGIRRKSRVIKERFEELGAEIEYMGYYSA